ncbi:hypothetical protein ABZ671_18790 [Micromonospora sp. NPDC006766]|uniref:hypothetical protein n=1 Tax=Micromonospora sp. NPDC006766 TaxID=3154778 RepID=UPI0033CA5E10
MSEPYFADHATTSTAQEPSLAITLCGSITRAPEALRRVERALALAGHLVNAPIPPLPGESDLTPGQLANLTTGHHAAIRRSDLVIAVVPDGRPGDSTRSEVRYAEQLGVPVRWVWDVDPFVAALGALAA